MNAVLADHNEFAPPPPGGMGRALTLAVLAHLLLVLALTWGLRWKNAPQDVAVEAELWAPRVQQATPRPTPRTPPPVEQATPKPPTPAPEPVRKAPPPQPVADEQRDAEIALAQKKQEEARKAARLEQERRAHEAAEQQRREQAQKQAAEEKKRQAEEQHKIAAQKEAERKAEAQKRAEAERKAEAQKKAEAERDAKAAEVRRKAELDRLKNLAGTADAGGGGGTAAREAGPSGGYAARVRAKVKPNIVFTDAIDGNPTAEVEVRTSPDGTIVGKRLLKSSGVPAWDAAVLRAIDKTEVMPRDTDGRVPTPMILEFRPRD